MSRPEDRIDAEELTVYLEQLKHGEASGSATETVLQRVIEELRMLARGHMQRQHASHTLQPEALVNEVFLKLFGSAGHDWKDRAHFFALAAKAMRQVLVDHSRRKHSLKRGSGADQITLMDPVQENSASRDVDVLDLEAALKDLAELDERQAQVVEMRYYGGLEVAEVAEALGVSVTTVEREWRAARVWLGRRLGPGRSSPES